MNREAQRHVERAGESGSALVRHWTSSRTHRSLLLSDEEG
jgi:hypothetical protein